MVRKKGVLALVFVLLVAFSLQGIYALSTSFFGDYQDDGSLEGNYTITLSGGELLPASSKLIFNTSQDEYNYTLSDVVSESTSQGDFYVKDSSVSGSGEGYGLDGQVEFSPEVSFELEVLSPGNNQTENNQTGSGDSGNESNNETSNETSPDDENETESNNQTENNESQIGVGDNEEPTSNETSSNETSGSDGEVNNDTDLDTNSTTSGSSDEGSSTEESSGGNETSTSPNDSETSDSTDGTSDSNDDSTDDTESSDPTSSDSAGDEASGSNEGSGDDGSTSDSSNDSGSTDVTGGAVSGIFQGVFGFFQSLLSPTGAVSMNVDENVEGIASVDNNFTYESLNSNQEVEVVEGSVKTSSENLSADDLNVERDGDTVIVSTDYSSSSSGYGQEFESSGSEDVVVDLSDLNNFSLPNQTGEDLEVRLVYEREEISSLNTKLSSSSVALDSEVSLNSSERETLVNEFGNFSVETSNVEVSNGRIFVRLKLEDYWIESSYDESLSEQELMQKVENDRTRWLKDISGLLSESSDEEKNSSKVDALEGQSYSI